MEFQLESKNRAAKESHKLLFSKNEIKMGYYWPIYKNSDGEISYTIHGGAFGTQNLFLVIPEYKLGISIITNQSDPDTHGKLLKLLNNLLTDIKNL